MDTNDPTSANGTGKPMKTVPGEEPPCLTTESFKTSPFGTSTRFGGGKPALWAICVTVGMLIGICCGIAIFVVASKSSKNALTVAISEAFPIAFVGIIACWFVIVDKRTIKGKNSHDEENVENAWVRQSTSWGYCVLPLTNTALFIASWFCTGPISVELVQMVLVGCLFLGPMACLVGYGFHYWKGTR